jgi:hypothetical protein
LVHKVR